jgi:hypothetical protein
MRTPIVATLVVPALLLIAAAVRAEPPAAESEQAAARTGATEEREFAPPPGFRPKKRGEFVVYCRREEPKGTRFPKEVCYDEKGIREMLQTQLEDQMKVDQIRRTKATTF